MGMDPVKADGVSTWSARRGGLRRRALWRTFRAGEDELVFADALEDDTGMVTEELSDEDTLLAEDGGALTPKGALLASLKMAEYIDEVYWGRGGDPQWRRCGPAVLAYVGLSSTDFDDIVEDMVDLLSPV